jgi:hypothetical protein
VPPVAAVARLALSPSTFRAARAGPATTAAAARTGTRVRYTLNVAALVRFELERASRGRTVGGRCVKATASNRQRQSCTRFVAVPGAFTRSRPAGADSFTFTGRIAGRALTPGRYRLAATPAANGRTGSPARASLRIVR